MKRALLTIAFITLMLPSAQAQECEDAEDQATMTACAEQAYEASDAELNALYREIEARLGDDADTKELLVEAERAWLAFRDAECAFSSSGTAGGSVYPMIQAMCLDTQTQTRISELQDYLACEEGDLGCPVPRAVN
ncbi:lysozyme inhibitor LprI family protein [Devosia nitrariae]|uniref:Lysozyme inhibitor LprI-like N-terminal domain-containing protein n=1 Tax=Devosia nitrariae TaxID=2071872 RepID=A0ABQ5W6K9_9HYPH|nr:lysozyme inhibitor LprI family protein [Devosia nitrariae]GLQ55439.1 hypothetical protein GCM10010862_26980 [Devosia nitrariae]